MLNITKPTLIRDEEAWVSYMTDLGDMQNAGHHLAFPFMVITKVFTVGNHSSCYHSFFSTHDAHELLDAEERPLTMPWLEGSVAGVDVRRLHTYHDDRGDLTELARNDQLVTMSVPYDGIAMAYISTTKPGVVRGPHEHARQTDVFVFFSQRQFTFVLYLWDNRPASRTYGTRHKICLGSDTDPARPAYLVAVPPGVVHAYKNVSTQDQWVLNFPDKLYKGPGKSGEVDEIRHEDDPNSRFQLW